MAGRDARSLDTDHRHNADVRTLTQLGGASSRRRECVQEARVRCILP